MFGGCQAEIRCAQLVCGHRVSHMCTLWTGGKKQKELTDEQKQEIKEAPRLHGFQDLVGDPLIM